MKFFAIIGEGPNGLEIPLVICQTQEEAQAIVDRIPKSEKNPGWIEDDFVERLGPYVGDDCENTALGEELYGLIFKDGNYYSGCGGCYSLRVTEYRYGQPMVGWDLD